MIERIPDDFINGGDSVTGASALTTTGAVPYVASPGVLTQDQYFLYTSWPNSPVAGNTFNRLNLYESTIPSDSPYDTNAGYDLSIRRTYTAFPYTPTAGVRSMAPAYLRVALNPSSDWNTNPVTSGALNAVTTVAAANTQPINNPYGVAGNVTNNGTGLIAELDGLYFTAFNAGGDITLSRGIYSAAATYGSGNVSLHYGAYAESNVYGTGVVTNNYNLYCIGGNFGTGVGGSIGTQASIRNVTRLDGPITTAYGYRHTISGATTPGAAWGISEESGWASRILGNLAVGPSNSATPSATLYVKDATATTGATSVTVDPGAAQTSASTILTLNGVLKYAGQNTTGAASASLGANCPAVTATAPYTWFRMVSSDGSTVYVPAWK